MYAEKRPCLHPDTVKKSLVIENPGVQAGHPQSIVRELSEKSSNAAKIEMPFTLRIIA